MVCETKRVDTFFVGFSCPACGEKNLTATKEDLVIVFGSLFVICPKCKKSSLLL